MNFNYDEKGDPIEIRSARNRQDLGGKQFGLQQLINQYLRKDTLKAVFIRLSDDKISYINNPLSMIFLCPIIDCNYVTSEPKNFDKHWNEHQRKLNGWRSFGEIWKIMKINESRNERIKICLDSLLRNRKVYRCEHLIGKETECGKIESEDDAFNGRNCTEEKIVEGRLIFSGKMKRGPKFESDKRGAKRFYTHKTSAITEIPERKSLWLKRIERSKIKKGSIDKLMEELNTIGKERETERYFRLGKLINLVCSIDPKKYLTFQIRTLRNDSN
jgi:hypothetical protein